MSIQYLDIYDKASISRGPLEKIIRQANTFVTILADVSINHTQSSRLRRTEQ